MQEVFRHDEDCLAAPGRIGSRTLAEASGVDPETWFAEREEATVRAVLLAYVMESLGKHRYGPAFVGHVLLGRSWQDLEAEHGVRANTLSKAFGHAVRRLGEECRQRLRRVEQQVRQGMCGLEVRHA